MFDIGFLGDDSLSTEPCRNAQYDITIYRLWKDNVSFVGWLSWNRYLRR